MIMERQLLSLSRDDVYLQNNFNVILCVSRDNYLNINRSSDIYNIKVNLFIYSPR